MKTGIYGLSLIKQFESLKHKPYLCPAKVPTIGYGTTIYPSGKKVSLTDKAITESEAEQYLKHDIESFEKSVLALVKQTISQNQFDALVSFTYNLGADNLKKSTLLKKININPNDESIKAEFIKWNKAGGVVLYGLTRRRIAESELYFKK